MGVSRFDPADVFSRCRAREVDFPKVSSGVASFFARYRGEPKNKGDLTQEALWYLVLVVFEMRIAVYLLRSRVPESVAPISGDDATHNSNQPNYGTHFAPDSTS